VSAKAEGAMARILIFDGAPARSQQVIASHGGPSNTEMFERALSLHEGGLEPFSLNVADGERLPQGAALADFDGIVITGSPLSVYKIRPEVTRQIELAREAFGVGVPMYGSCWGLQLMTAALGGVVRLNPEGREVGIARNIAPNHAGSGHYLFSGKPTAFDALCSHQDDVATLPPDAVTLASNTVSQVQALEISRGASHFVGVQYHPEHTFATTAAIIEARQELMVAEGFAQSVEGLRSVIADLRALETDPCRRDIAWKLGVDKQVLDPRQRTAELGNWLRARALPRCAERAAAA
jgi:GMP synthase (glutamine-hydrolysing)